MVVVMATTGEGAGGRVTPTPSLAPTKSRQLSTFVWNDILIVSKSSLKPPLAGCLVSTPPCNSSADIGTPPEAAGAMISHGEGRGSGRLLPLSPATPAVGPRRAPMAPASARF